MEVGIGLLDIAFVTIVIAKDGRVLKTLLSNLKQIDLSLVDNDLEQLLQ